MHQILINALVNVLTYVSKIICFCTKIHLYQAYGNLYISKSSVIKNSWGWHSTANTDAKGGEQKDWSVWFRLIQLYWKAYSQSYYLGNSQLGSRLLVWDSDWNDSGTAYLVNNQPNPLWSTLRPMLIESIWGLLKTYGWHKNQKPLFNLE